MFKNEPRFIIIHSTNLGNMDDLELDHGRFNKKLNGRQFQGHYFIDSDGNIITGRDESDPTYHILSDNSIQIYIQSDYNFKSPSNDALIALKIKIEELTKRYQISYTNVMTQTQFEMRNKMIFYLEWVNSTYYYPNNIVLYKNELYKIIEQQKTVMNLENIENYFKTSFNVVNKNVNNIQIEISANQYARCEVGNYVYFHDVQTILNPRLITLLDNKTSQIISKDGSNLITINQTYNTSISPDVTGVIYTKVKPISDYNCTFYLTGLY